MTENITKTEAWLLNLLYELRSASVQDLLDKANEVKSWRYTTVLTLLQRMERKGYVNSYKMGKKFIFQPTRSPEIFFEQFINDNMGNLLRRYPNPLISYFLKISALNERDKKMLSTLLQLDNSSESANSKDYGVNDRKE